LNRHQGALRLVAVISIHNFSELLKLHSIIMRVDKSKSGTSSALRVASIKLKMQLCEDIFCVNKRKKRSNHTRYRNSFLTNLLNSSSPGP